MLAACVEWAIALAWLSRVIVAHRKLPLVPDLLALPEPPASTGRLEPVLTVIVPARNEAGAIAATLRSLVASEAIGLEIIAVNDRSADETGAIMRACAAESESRLRVIDIDDLPPGWMGKTHAMALAASKATTPYLLFTDGDVLFAPDALRRVMHFVTTNQADHFVLLPTLILKSWPERMIISAIQVLGTFGPRLWRIPDPAAPDFIGVGAFNLVRTEAYRAAGGFESLRMEVVEDLRLGFILKRAGYRSAVAFGRGLVRLHWAPGALGIVNGLTKNAFAIFRFRLLEAVPVLVGLFVFTLAPIAGFFGPAMVRLPSLVTLAALAVLYARSRPVTDGGIRYLVTFPAAALLLMYALGRSIVVTLATGGVRWRGTRYPLRELRRMAGPLR